MPEDYPSTLLAEDEHSIDEVGVPCPHSGQTGPWYVLEPARVLELWHVSLEQGLSQGDAEARREHYGRYPTDFLGDVPTASVSEVWTLCRQALNQPVAWTLLVGACLCAGLGAVSWAWVIGALWLVGVVMTGGTGYYAYHVLNGSSQQVCRHYPVFREGQEHWIHGTDLVPGDLCILRAGDVVPAYGRLVQSFGLQVDETSVFDSDVDEEAVFKDVIPLLENVPFPRQSNMVFPGSLVLAGRGVAVVLDGTEFYGVHPSLKASASVRNALSATPTVVVLRRFQVWLWVVGLLVGTAVMSIALAQGVLPELAVIQALALVLATVPVAVPTVVVLLLIWGVARFQNQRILMKTLLGLEASGTADTVLVDDAWLTDDCDRPAVCLVVEGQVVSTGEEGALTLSGHTIPMWEEVQPVSALGILIQAGVLSVSPWPTPRESALESALLAVAAQAGLNGERIREGALQESFQQDPLTGAVLTGYRHFGTGPCGNLPDALGLHPVVVRGEAQSFLSRCNGQLNSDGTGTIPLQYPTWQGIIEDLGRQSLSVLAYGLASHAFLVREHSGNDTSLPWILVGLVGYRRSPCSEISTTELFHQDEKPEPIIFTEESPAYGFWLAEHVGWEAPEVLTDTTLDAMSEGALQAHALQASHRVTPGPSRVLSQLNGAQHRRWIHGLQASGQRVAVVGTGLGILPVLSVSDVGIIPQRDAPHQVQRAAQIELLTPSASEAGHRLREMFRDSRQWMETVTQYLVWSLGNQLGLTLLGVSGMIIAVAQSYGPPLAYDPLWPVAPLQMVWLILISGWLLPMFWLWHPASLGNVTDSSPEEYREVYRDEPQYGGTILGLTATRRQWLTLVGALSALVGWGALLWAADTGLSQAVATTTVVNALVMVHGASLLSCSRWSTPLWEGISRRPIAQWGVIGGCLLLQLMFTYCPVAHSLLGSAPLGWSPWWIVMGSGMTALLVLEGVKYMHNPEPWERFLAKFWESWKTR